MKEKHFNDIFESDIYYRFQNFKFYFSSNLRLQKFKNHFEDYAKNEALKLIYRYNLKADVESFKLMFVFAFYLKCEIRGFRVEKYTNDEFNILICTIKELPTFSVMGVE